MDVSGPRFHAIVNSEFPILPIEFASTNVREMRKSYFTRPTLEKYFAIKIF